MAIQSRCTLTDYQLKVILENEKTKARKWQDICRELKITSNKLYGNLIYLGLRGQKQIENQKEKQNDKYFNWETAKKTDFIFTVKDTH